MNEKKNEETTRDQSRSFHVAIFVDGYNDNCEERERGRYGRKLKSFLFTFTIG